MKVWSIISQKGGTGKTTLAINLAIRAKQQNLATLIFDLDPQQSAKNWNQLREGINPGIIAGDPKKLESMVDAARQGGADLIIIDTPPRTSLESELAVNVSDLVLIPVRPSLFDLAAISETRNLLRDVNAKEKSQVLFNAVAARTAECEVATEVVHRYGLKVCKSRIHDRVAFRRALNKGLGVTEFAPDSFAAIELDYLYSNLCQSVLGYENSNGLATGGLKFQNNPFHPKPHSFENVRIAK